MILKWEKVLDVHIVVRILRDCHLNVIDVAVVIVMTIIFLKTIIPSRKMTKQYLGGDTK